MSHVSLEPASLDFEDFDRRYRRLVRRIIIRKCRIRDVNVANDIMQEAMIRAWKYQASLKRSDDPVGWLIAIATNVYKTYYRKTRGRLTWSPMNDSPPKVMDEEPPICQAGIDPLHWLAPYAKGLPGLAGELIELFTVYGKDYCTIARELGKSEQQVRAATQELRRTLIEAFSWGDLVWVWRVYPTAKNMEDATIRLFLEVEGKGVAEDVMWFQVWWALVGHIWISFDPLRFPPPAKERPMSWDYYARGRSSIEYVTPLLYSVLDGIEAAERSFQNPRQAHIMLSELGSLAHLHADTVMIRACGDPEFIRTRSCFRGALSWCEDAIATASEVGCDEDAVRLGARRDFLQARLQSCLSKAEQ